MSSDLVDAAWTDKPATEAPPIWVHPTKFAGQSAADKLAKVNPPPPPLAPVHPNPTPAQVRAACRKSGADGTVLTALDDIAWTLNLRGADIDCNPLLCATYRPRRAAPRRARPAQPTAPPRRSMSFLLVDQAGGTLFVNPGQVGDDVRAHLQDAGVASRPYDDAYSAVAEAVSTGKRFLVDEGSCNVAVADALGDAAVVGTSPVVLPRVRARPACRTLPSLTPPQAVKNEVELRNMWEAHLKDAVALCRYYAWSALPSPLLLRSRSSPHTLTARPPGSSARW